MTISLAFLAPNLVKAAVEGRLPRGIGIERLRDPPMDWSRQFEALGLNPEQRCAQAVRRAASAAGNGIFGCRDRAPKIAAKTLDRLTACRDQNPGIERPEIPAETPYLALCWKPAVCGDWMVGAPGLEPGTR
jgi:hypothetical protein